MRSFLTWTKERSSHPAIIIISDLQHSETCRKAEKLLDTHVFKHLLSGQQAESPAAKTEASEKLFALEYDVKVVVKELIRATLDGVLALSLGRGLVEVTDKLFAQLKAFPRELPRTFSTSSRSRVSFIRLTVVIIPSW